MDRLLCSSRCAFAIPFSHPQNTFKALLSTEDGNCMPCLHTEFFYQAEMLSDENERPSHTALCKHEFSFSSNEDLGVDSFGVGLEAQQVRVNSWKILCYLSHCHFLSWLLFQLCFPILTNAVSVLFPQTSITILPMKNFYQCPVPMATPAKQLLLLRPREQCRRGRRWEDFKR